ncbi:hypothetical protein COCNU_01G001750 [Cocos nucifera]|uniref:Uncharacterized protein n=1 Tax=Cocos nucifera TaxID=13894 RepID=A0A8K0HSM8_COCNU|nr:hypothetical protein COCNU_01G001750 [Cocos nucifera]
MNRQNGSAKDGCRLLFRIFYLFPYSPELKSGGKLGFTIFPWVGDMKWPKEKIKHWLITFISMF